MDILTLSATGSEYDSGCVITNISKNDKRGYMDDIMFPKVSLLDPTYTFSVNKWQTACGTADAINHLLEQYFAYPNNSFNDGLLIEGMKTLMKNVKIALEEPNNYDARSELMYLCTLACNGILSNGSGSSGWPMHSIEHALSGYFDITHGAGLAIITPRWMKEILSNRTLERFVTLGIRLFEFDSNMDKEEMANKVIDNFYQFFLSIGIPMHLKELGVDENRIEEMAKHILHHDSTLGEFMYVELDEAALIRILKASM